MANDKQSRQQSSERTQTASGSAQQGEWQSGQRGTSGQQGFYPDESRAQSAPREMARPAQASQHPTFGPFSMMRRMTEDIERMFENFGMGRSFFPTDFWEGGREAMMAAWSPRIEMCENDGKLCISADLPGVKKEDLQVSVTEDAVTIEGERRQERTTDERGLYQSERSYGSFYRTIPLPEGVQPESASAEFKDGVLQIEIPAPERKSRTHKLEIKG